MTVKNKKKKVFPILSDGKKNLGILLNKNLNYVFISVQKCFFSARQTEFLQNIHLQLNGNGKPLQNGKTTGS